METLLKIVQTVNMYLSDYVLVILLIGAGLYFTIRTKFVQVRCFGEGWRRFFGEFSLNGEKHKAGMSSFQALATAVAAQVGTGNIVGRLRRDPHRRPRRDLLDVVHRILRHGDDLCRGGARTGDPRGRA